MTTPEPVPEQAITAAAEAIHDQVCTVWRSHDLARDQAEARAALEAAAPAIRAAERQRWRTKLGTIADEWESWPFTQMDRGYAADVLRRVLELDAIEAGAS